MMKAYIKSKFTTDIVTKHDYFLALLLAIAASAIVFGLERLTVERFSNINSVLILAVLVSAILLGKGPALLTAVLCTFFYDWLLVPPFFMTTNGYDDMLKLGVFTTAALLTSWIASMTKDYAIKLLQREKQLEQATKEREYLRQQKEEERVRREVELLRSAILTSVSHDLKSPLSSIIGAMSSFKLYAQELSEDDKQKLVDMVLVEGNRLLGYMNNILEFAKLEHGKAILKQEVVAIDDAIDLTLKRLSSRLKHYQLSIKQTQEGLAFKGDERLMDIALGNVIDNAMKYSEKGSCIALSIAACEENQMLLVTVEDQGVGISDALAAQIFDTLHRTKRSDSTNAGTGLGLWITRRIIEAHGGTVSIGPRKQAKGTRVEIRLPLTLQQLLPEIEAIEWGDAA